ncbi:MAG: class I SAM-dependent methyltransferase [Nanoarchaeota archaeon]|nr:class I SAM-dependent methyltransferase [Nanoarchaeota archaeon]MBU1005810.1 class I SAM-dependent methyltransferase [Nanoarchaeota archaeon]
MGYYDEISEGYEELYKEEQLKKVELIKGHLKVKASDKLLDVGCGTGLTTEPWDCIRYGVDPAPKLLERARLQSEIEYKLAPAENIPYPDGFFDVVISITAIQNFADIEKGLSEIKRVGKKRFVLSFLKKSIVPNGSSKPSAMLDGFEVSSKAQTIKKESIDKLIRKIFKIKKIIEEDKDMIYFCE